MSAGIVIAGRVDFAPDKRDAALSGAQELIARALAERGCVHYAWTADPYDPGRVHVFEEWDTAADLAAHLVGEPYRGMLAHLSALTILAAETIKYRFDRRAPVYNSKGVATASFDESEFE